MASVSGIYDGSGNYLFDVLDLLQMMELTPQQINELVKQDRETLFHE
ncbi:MAG: hypothetical protein LIP01_13665 [Tannerellaceae bacterium]|nr:hypothetical protein [Tannerellaceae bacterium]